MEGVEHKPNWLHVAELLDFQPVVLMRGRAHAGHSSIASVRGETFNPFRFARLVRADMPGFVGVAKTLVRVQSYKLC
jgi:hypothetical protein